MRRVHSDLKDYRGFANPLEKVAEKTGEATVICLMNSLSVISLMLCCWEIYCEGSSIEVLFGCYLKYSPDRLYLNGLQRQQFLPAIALLKKHCMVINVDGGVDHRLRKLEKTALYHHPLSDKTYQSIKAVFEISGLPIPLLWKTLS